jgi:signal peptidase I
VPRPEPKFSRPAKASDDAAPDAAAKKGAKDDAPKRTFAEQAVDGLKQLASAVAIFLVLRVFLVQAYNIPSSSMEDSLLIGDFLMATNVIYGAHVPFTDARIPGFRTPRQGEIVVFRPTYNNPIQDVVKRVIGVPGDTLRSVDGKIFRNGKPLDEPYVKRDGSADFPIALRNASAAPDVDPALTGHYHHLPALLPGAAPTAYAPTRDTWGPLVVPAGHYWLMGDNRDQSLDSRFMGFIPGEVIRGTPLFIYYSYNRQADRALPWLTAVRWGRIGTVIR